MGQWKGRQIFCQNWQNVVSVYETETFTLIVKNSIKVENFMEFGWSPTNAILALFVSELGNQPAKVSLSDLQQG
ncbi:hypothetical protein vseg_019678 [Gypsophila vaccaria]